MTRQNAWNDSVTLIGIGFIGFVAGVFCSGLLVSAPNLYDLVKEIGPTITGVATVVVAAVGVQLAWRAHKISSQLATQVYRDALDGAELFFRRVTLVCGQVRLSVSQPNPTTYSFVRAVIEDLILSEEAFSNIYSRVHYDLGRELLRVNGLLKDTISSKGDLIVNFRHNVTNIETGSSIGLGCIAYRRNIIVG